MASNTIFQSSVENKYRGFEVCLNHMFKSCIQDKDTYLVSFAHNENEDEQTLKYDLHSKSAVSFAQFYNRLRTMLCWLSFKSNGKFTYLRGNVSPLPPFKGLREVARCFRSGATDVIIYDGLYIGFDFHSVTDSEIIFFMEIHQYFPVQERAFIESYLSFVNDTFIIPESVDQQIYADTDWCWGERFTITHDGVKYTG